MNKLLSFLLNNLADVNYRNWLIDVQQKRSIPFNLNPDDSEYDYNMARLYNKEPVMYYDAIPHWPSEFKRENHPNRYVNGIDTLTGLPINYLLNWRR